jgi:hypothetical protein
MLEAANFQICLGGNITHPGSNLVPSYGPTLSHISQGTRKKSDGEVIVLSALSMSK